MKHLFTILLTSTVVLVLFSAGCPQATEPGDTGFPGGLPIECVSVSGSGVEGNDDSGDPSISSDGRYVAFQSFASNLVTGDTGGFYDIFVYNRQSNTVERVSVNGSGIQGNWPSRNPSIAGNARYVAFCSGSTNLVPGDTNGINDIFVYDRETEYIKRVSVNASGNEANGSSELPSISSNGRYVSFDSNASNLVTGDTNGAQDVFVAPVQ